MFNKKSRIYRVVIPDSFSDKKKIEKIANYVKDIDEDDCKIIYNGDEKYTTIYFSQRDFKYFFNKFIKGDKKLLFWNNEEGN